MAEIPRAARKPISYLSLQSIMSHLSFEKRIELTQKAPATRAVHQSVPLKLNRLEMNQNEIQINETTYSVGVITHYPDAPAPEWAVISNSRGGSKRDIVEEEIDPAPSNLETANNYEREAKLKEMLTISALSRDLPSEKEKAEIQYLREKTREYHEKLAISKLKKVHFIQFTVTTLFKAEPRMTRNIERMCYGVPLENAKVYLIEKMLANKKTYVRNLLKIHPGLSWPGCNMFHFAGNRLNLEDGNVTSVIVYGNQFNKLQSAKFEGDKKYPVRFWFEIGESKMEETMRKVLELMPEIRLDQETMGEIARREFPLFLDAQIPNKLFLTIEINKTFLGQTEQVYSFNLIVQKWGEEREEREEQEALMALERENRDEQEALIALLHLDRPNRAPRVWARNLRERNERRRAAFIRRL